MNRPFNASDRRSIREAEKAAKVAEANRRAVVVALMDQQLGREYIWTLLSEAGIFTQVFSTDPLILAFNEGRRSMGLRLLDDVTTFTPDQFIQAMREANGRRTVDNASRSPEAERGAGEQPGSEKPGWDAEGLVDPAEGDGEGD